MCTTFAEGDGRPWCPTEVSSDGTMFSGSKKWGYCDRRCPFQDGLGQRVESTTPKSTLRRGRPRKTTTRAPDFIPSIFTTPKTTTEAFDPIEYQETNPDSLKGNWLPDPLNYECGLGLSVGYVLGGEQTAPGELPFMALLGYWEPKRSRIEFHCGGALINRRYVVTAAHCHAGGKLQIATVILGEFDVGKDPDCAGCRPTQRFTPEEVIIHPEYSQTGGREADLALVRLNRPVTTFNEDIATNVISCKRPHDT